MISTSRRCALLALVCASLQPVGAASVLSNWESDHLAGRRAFELGRYDQAQMILQKAMDEATAAGAGPAQLGKVLNDLAFIYLKQGQPAKAEPLLQRALTTRQQALGDDHPDVAQALNNLASLNYLQGDLSQAERRLAQAVAIWTKLSWPDCADANVTLNNYVELLRKNGRQVDAQKILARVDAARFGVRRADSFDSNLQSDGTLWSTYVCAGLTQYQKGNYQEAQKLFQQGLSEAERSYPDGHRVIQSMNALAAVYQDQANYPAAIDMYKRALELKEKTVGPDDPDILPQLRNLGALLFEQGILSDAEPLYRRTLSLREKVSAEDPAAFASSLADLALLLCQEGKVIEAEPYCLQLRELSDKPTDTGIAALSGLANVERSRKNYPEAESLYKRALQSINQAGTGDSIVVAPVLKGLAGVYDDQEKHTTAEPLYRRAIAVYAKDSIVFDAEFGAVVACLAQNLIAQQKFSEAEALLKQLLTVKTKQSGRNGRNLIPILERLSGIYVATEKLADSEQILTRLIAIKQERYGTSDIPDLVSDRAKLANIQMRLKKYSDAETGFQQVLKSYQTAKEPSQALIASCFRDIAIAQHRQKKYVEAEQNYRLAADVYERTYGNDYPELASVFEPYNELLLENNRWGWASYIQCRLSQIKPGNHAIRTISARGKEL